MDNKTCTKCAEVKSINEFYRDRRGKNGISAHCKDCDKRSGKIYNTANKEKNSQYQKAYNVHNKEKISIKNKKQYAKNRETRLLYQAKYNEDNKEKIQLRKKQRQAENSERLNAISRAYGRNNKAAISIQKKLYREEHIEHIKEQRKSNPHIGAAQSNRRRAAKIFRTPLWFNAEKEQIADLYKEAQEFREAGIDVHVDHIVPLQGKLVSGLHTLANLQILEASLNLSKNNSFEI